MRTWVLVLALATGNAAALPGHLQGLPEGVLHHGPAPAGLGQVGAGEHAPLWLPGGARTFEVERVVAAGADTTRFGRVRGIGHAAVTLGRSGGFARVTQGATVWLLEYRGGETFALRAGEGGLAFADYDHGALVPAGSAPPKNVAPAPVRAALRTVDFAALYDADFAARYPGDLARTRIAHFVALANQAFVDSNVFVTLRLVAAVPAPGVEHPSALVNIEALYDAHRGGGRFGGVDVLALRAQAGADLLTYFRVQDLYAREVCGVAFFPGSYRAGVNVVMDGASGGSVCDDYTFAHEVGHNFGARHQLAADATAARGHAFVRSGQFTTIMRSFGTGRRDRNLQLGYFSNPRIACGNLPCGTAGSEDNAGAMNDNAARIAGYRIRRIAGRAARPDPVLADSDGDGVIDRIDAFPFDAARRADRDGDGRADADDAFPDNSTEWADTDAGGLGDNADSDDDNDGVADGSDAFRLDPLESADADNDGTGDAGDAFDADAREQRDTDGDGTGDRADADDDGDGAVDVATLAAAADGELLVADGATDRILRFRGADYAPLGTLLQLGAGEVTFRSGIAAAPSGEVYVVAASQLRALDRLRSAAPELVLDTASHPQVGTGFPMTPVMLASGDVMIGEMGVGALLALRPAPSRAAAPALRRYALVNNSAPHLCRDNGGELLMLDGAHGALYAFTHAGDPLTSGPAPSFRGTAVPVLSSGDTAQAPNGILYWVDRRDGAVRSLYPANGADAGITLADADAATIAVGPDGVLLVGRRAGGVHAYDADDGADLGLVITAPDAAEPLGLAWAPRILDADLPAIVPPAPPAPVADPATTPAVGGTPPPPPPCTTDCAITEFSDGGAFGAGLMLALFALAGVRRRVLSAS